MVTVTEDGYLHVARDFDKVSFPIDLAFNILWNAANEQALYGASGPPQDKEYQCPDCGKEIKWARHRSH